jgi:hypothetical protein
MLRGKKKRGKEKKKKKKNLEIHLIGIEINEISFFRSF